MDFEPYDAIVTKHLDPLGIRDFHHWGLHLADVPQAAGRAFLKINMTPNRHGRSLLPPWIHALTQALRIEGRIF